jgi:hypothetical protein
VRGRRLGLTAVHLWLLCLEPIEETLAPSIQVRGRPSCGDETAHERIVSANQSLPMSLTGDADRTRFSEKRCKPTEPNKHRTLSEAPDDTRPSVDEGFCGSKIAV